MKEALTARQIQILKAIIEEYTDIAEPVGSLALEKKYNLGVSPATIRNEMANLTRLGYLRQPHTSAGRVPSPLAIKFYINQLMEERRLGVAEEVKAKESVWDVRGNVDHLLNEATKSLADKTSSLAVAVTDDGNAWAHGHGNVFASPEFSDYHVCQTVFDALEQEKSLREIFFERLTGVSPIEVLFGEEMGWDFFEPVGIVATRLTLPNGSGAIAVVGPYRQDYRSVIPLVRYFGSLIQEIISK